MSSANKATSICRIKRCATERSTCGLRSLRTSHLKHSASLSAASLVTATRSFSKFGLGLPGARNSSGPQRSGKSLSASVSLGVSSRCLWGGEVGVEIVNAELVEVAQHDVARAVGNEAHPVIESLPVVLLQIRAALFHFHQHDGFPNKVGESGAAGVFGYTKFQRGPGFL